MGGGVPAWRPPDEERVRTQLVTETAYLDRLIDALRRALEEAGTARSVEADTFEWLREDLLTCDYVYADFADLPNASRAFAGRALLSALAYRDRLGRVLERMQEEGSR
jgi:hypothetical protein